MLSSFEWSLKIPNKKLFLKVSLFLCVSIFGPFFSKFFFSSFLSLFLSSIDIYNKKMTTVLTKEQHVNSILQLSAENKIPLEPSTTVITETTTTITRRQNTLYHVFLSSILHLLHFIYITCIAFKTFKSYLYNHITTANTTTIHQRIQYDKENLTKIPNHLSINISRELSSSRTLEKWDEIMYSISFVTCWAWEFGIKEVSVYDQSGKL